MFLQRIAIVRHTPLRFLAHLVAGAAIVHFRLHEKLTREHGICRDMIDGCQIALPEPIVLRMRRCLPQQLDNLAVLFR